MLDIESEYETSGDIYITRGANIAAYIAKNEKILRGINPFSWDLKDLQKNIVKPGKYYGVFSEKKTGKKFLSKELILKEKPKITNPDRAKLVSENPWPVDEMLYATTEKTKKDFEIRLVNPVMPDCDVPGVYDFPPPNTQELRIEYDDPELKGLVDAQAAVLDDEGDNSEFGEKNGYLLKLRFDYAKYLEAGNNVLLTGFTISGLRYVCQGTYAKPIRVLLKVTEPGLILYSNPALEKLLQQEAAERGWQAVLVPPSEYRKYEELGVKISEIPSVDSFADTRKMKKFSADGFDAMLGHQKAIETADISQEAGIIIDTDGCGLILRDATETPLLTACDGSLIIERSADSLTLKKISETGNETDAYAGKVKELLKNRFAEKKFRYLFIIGSEKEFPVQKSTKHEELSPDGKMELVDAEVLDGVYYSNLDDDDELELYAGRLPSADLFEVAGYFNGHEPYGNDLEYNLMVFPDTPDVRPDLGDQAFSEDTLLNQFAGGGYPVVFRDYKTPDSEPKERAFWQDPENPGEPVIITMNPEKEKMTELIRDSDYFEVHTHGCPVGFEIYHCPPNPRYDIYDVPYCLPKRPVIFADACSTSKVIGKTFIDSGAKNYAGCYEPCGTSNRFNLILNFNGMFSLGEAFAIYIQSEFRYKTKNAYLILYGDPSTVMLTEKLSAEKIEKNELQASVSESGINVVFPPVEIESAKLGQLGGNAEGIEFAAGLSNPQPWFRFGEKCIVDDILPENAHLQQEFLIYEAWLEDSKNANEPYRIAEINSESSPDGPMREFSVVQSEKLSNGKNFSDYDTISYYARTPEGARTKIFSGNIENSKPGDETGVLKSYGNLVLGWNTIVDKLVASGKGKKIQGKLWMEYVRKSPNETFDRYDIIVSDYAGKNYEIVQTITPAKDSEYPDLVEFSFSNSLKKDLLNYDVLKVVEIAADGKKIFHNSEIGTYNLRKHLLYSWKTEEDWDSADWTNCNPFTMAFTMISHIGDNGLKIAGRILADKIACQYDYLKGYLVESKNPLTSGTEIEEEFGRGKALLYGSCNVESVKAMAFDEKFVLDYLDTFYYMKYPQDTDKEKISYLLRECAGKISCNSEKVLIPEYPSETYDVKLEELKGILGPEPGCERLQLKIDCTEPAEGTYVVAENDSDDESEIMPAEAQVLSGNAVEEEDSVWTNQTSELESEIVDITNIPGVYCNPLEDDCRLKEKAAAKLKEAAEYAMKQGYGIYVFSAYRSPETQMQKFRAKLANGSSYNNAIKTLCGPTSYAARQNPVAYAKCPHSTGGALDVLAVKNTNPGQGDYYDYRSMTNAQKEKIFEIMSSACFSRYTGEGWHFEYGTEQLWGDGVAAIPHPPQCIEYARVSALENRG